MSYRYGRSSSDAGLILSALTVVIFVVGIFAYNIAWANSTEQITCTITDKDRSGGDSGNSQYRVYTEQCDVLSNEDSWLQDKWDSATIQGQLKENHTYVLEVNGWRVGFFSTFPNIGRVVKEVK